MIFYEDIDVIFVFTLIWECEFLKDRWVEQRLTTKPNLYKGTDLKNWVIEIYLPKFQKKRRLAGIFINMTFRPS